MPPIPPTIHLSDVMPPTLNKNTREPVVDRLRAYRMWHRRQVGNWQDHPNSRVGSYTLIVNRINLADTHRGVRTRYANFEAWAEQWGVTIT